MRTDQHIPSYRQENRRPAEGRGPRIDLPKIFAALGDRTRLAIINRLLEKGEMPVGALLDVADISAPAISRHLRILREAGLVRQRVDRQRRLYSVRKDIFEQLRQWFSQSALMLALPVMVAASWD